MYDCVEFHSGNVVATRHFHDDGADDDGLGLRFRTKYHTPSLEANRMYEPTHFDWGGHVCGACVHGKSDTATLRYVPRYSAR